MTLSCSDMLLCLEHFSPGTIYGLGNGSIKVRQVSTTGSRSKILFGPLWLQGTLGTLQPLLLWYPVDLHNQLLHSSRLRKNEEKKQCQKGSKLCMVVLSRTKTLTACRNARNVQVSKSMLYLCVCVWGGACICEISLATKFAACDPLH